MEQLSREEFLKRFGPGGLTPAEQQARREQSGRRQVGIRRNDRFEPNPREYRGERRPVLSEVSERMAAEAALADIEERENVARNEMAARGGAGMRADSRFVDEWTGEQGAPGSRQLFITPLTEAEARRTGGSEFGRKVRAARGQQELLSALKTVDEQLPAVNEATGQRYFQDGQSTLASALGVPLSQVSASVAQRTGQFMDTLGLDAGRAFVLAKAESDLEAQGVTGPALNQRLGKLMRDYDMFRAGEAATEIRPEVLGSAVPDSGPDVSSVIGALADDDPAVIAAHEGYRQLNREETKRLAYESGNQRRLGTGRRRNPFLKEPFVQEQLPGGIPVLTGEASEQAQTRGSDGNYHPAYKAVIGPDGSITAEPVMQIPQSWPVRLDPAYETQLRATLKQALYGNPTAPETQAARALLKELNANPQYAFDEGGRPRVTRAPDLRVASLNVINPTAYALSPEAVRTSLDTESKSEIGSYGGIANTVLPDVGQGEHGFRDIDDPFTERRFIEKQLTSGQQVRALKQDSLTPIRSYVISETSDLEPPVVWPRGVQDAVVGPKSAMPMVVEHDGQLWSVSQTPLGRGANGEPLYQHQLARPVYPMPGDPVVNDEGRLVASFRVGTPGRGEPSMITTEGFRQIGDFLAQEAELQGLTQPGGPRLALMSNQPSSSPDLNTLDYRLLVDSGAINPAGSSYVVGEFPNERVTREVGASVDPRANHLYRQINAMAALASQPGDPRLTTFDPAGSEDVRHYMTQLAPRAQEKIDAMAAARKAVGLPGSGASDAAKAGRRGQPSVNAFATFDAGAPPELAAAVSGDPGARQILAPDTLPPEVRRQLELNKLVNPASGAFNQHGMNWLRGHGRAYLQDAIEQSRPRPAAQPAGSGAWMEGESYPRVPSVPTPQGDAPVYSAGLPGARGLATSRPPGGAMPPLPEDAIPEVTYVPTERGTYVITDEGTTRLSTPAGAAVVTGRTLPSATDVLVGEQLAAYVQEARARIAQQNAAQQEARALRVEAARNRADRAGIVRSPRL